MKITYEIIDILRQNRPHKDLGIEHKRVCVNESKQNHIERRVELYR